MADASKLIQQDQTAQNTNNELNILARGAGISFVTKFAGRGLQLITQILLARLLGPSLFGLLVLGQVVLQLVSQFGGLGLATGIVRFGVPARDKGPAELSDVLRHVFSIGLLSGLVFGSATFLVAPWLAAEIFRQPALTDVLRGFGVAAALLIWLNISSAGTRISKRVEYSAFSQDIIPDLVNLLVVILLLYGLHFSIMGAVLAEIFGDALGLVCIVFFVRRLFPGVHLRGALFLPKMWAILTFSLPNLFATVFNLWLPTITVLCLGYFALPEHVGVFQAAEQVSMLSAIILSAFGAILAPQVASLHHIGDRQKLKEIFIVSTKWGLYLSLPLLLVIACLPEEVMVAVYGSSYAAGASLLVLIMLGQLVNTATGPVWTLLSMSGHQNRLLFHAGVAFTICILLNLWFIPALGSVGAALALAGAIVVLNLSLLWDVYRLLGIYPYDRCYYKMGIAIFVTAPSIFVISRIWPAESLLGLVIVSLVSLCIFAATLLLLGLENYELQLFVSLRDKLISR